MFLYVIIHILTTLLLVTLYFSFKFAIIILRLQETLDESLDVIDEKYNIIGEVCERPLFYDSPEVRRVLQEIKGVRSALHSIAKSLTSNFSEEDKENN